MNNLGIKNPVDLKKLSTNSIHIAHINIII
jgi:hypothetical protein